MTQLPLALTVGDPAGIGPEIVLRVLADPARPAGPLRVYGPRLLLDDQAVALGLAVPERPGVEVVDVPISGPLAIGEASAAGGACAAAAVLRAAADARAGKVAGLVTAPLHKHALRLAGHRWPGHTELLAEAAGVSDVAMMFVGGGLRVALVTIHLALRQVPDAVSAFELARVARLVHRELPRFGAVRRRIAVCGLNPHAGEAGLFGHEEEDVHRPVLESLRAEGLDVVGPLPADTLFVHARRGDYDAVLANYHDQGLVPVKLAAFGQAVNVTLGLPFVRTSVDHGTAFDIAGRGVADAGSLLAALQLAAELAAEPVVPGTLSP